MIFVLESGSDLWHTTREDTEMSGSKCRYHLLHNGNMSSEGTKQDLAVLMEPDIEVRPTAPQRRGILSRVSRKIWGEDARERNYVQKLDSFLL